MSQLSFDRPPAAVPLDRKTLLARFDGIRQFARGGRRAPNKPLLLLYALARLKHDRQTEIRFNTTEAAVQPLLRVYGPWGASARVSYPYSRLISDGLWQLPDRADLFDAGGNIPEGVARERDVPAGFTPDVLATFEREPELIDVVALHLLERHFAPGLHEEILEAVGLELGTPVATRRRDMAFRAAVLEAYLAQCCVCGLLRALEEEFTPKIEAGVAPKCLIWTVFALRTPQDTRRDTIGWAVWAVMSNEGGPDPMMSPAPLRSGSEP